MMTVSSYSSLNAARPSAAVTLTSVLPLTAAFSALEAEMQRKLCNGDHVKVTTGETGQMYRILDQKTFAREKISCDRLAPSVIFRDLFALRTLHEDNV